MDDARESGPRAEPASHGGRGRLPRMQWPVPVPTESRVAGPGLALAPVSWRQANRELRAEHEVGIPAFGEGPGNDAYRAPDTSPQKLLLP